MINEDTFKNLNIKGKNILKNANALDVIQYSFSDMIDDNIDNLIINSNLDNINSIK